MPAVSIDVHSNASYTLFPNPTDEKIQLRTEQLQREISLSVWDALGRQQAHYSGPAGQEWELDIPGPPGLYYIQLEMMGGRKRVWKVVKK